MIKRNTRYRIVDGKTCIEVRIRSAQQLFDARDPAPFRERDIDEDFVEYIEASADEIAITTPLKLLIYIGEDALPTLDAPSIISAIHAHFNYQVTLKRAQLSRILRTGQLFSVIGFLCLFSSIALLRYFNLSPYIREGTIILGWVAMWKPMELLLFDWYPVYTRIRLYKKLASTDIEVHFKQEQIPTLLGVR